MFLLVSVRHCVGAHPDEFQHGVSIQSSINLGKTFPRISRILIIPSTQILARLFVYLPPFISQILDEWRDTEDQQYFVWQGVKRFCQYEWASSLRDLNIKVAFCFLHATCCKSLPAQFFCKLSCAAAMAYPKNNPCCAILQFRLFVGQEIANSHPVESQISLK